MRFSNFFRIVWWLLLSATVTFFLYARYPDLVAGRSAPADVVVFLIWIALLLVPIFQEVELFGLRLKQQVEKLKDELRADIQSIRVELRNAVDVRTIFSPNITFPALPPDAQLPDLAVRVREAVTEALAAHGIARPAPVRDVPAVSPDVSFLFETRYGLERELRRLARERDLDAAVRRVGGLQLARILVQAGVLEPPLERAIREVYAVTSAAIHSEDVTPAQVEFVRRVGPDVIGALRALGSRDELFDR